MKILLRWLMVLLLQDLMLVQRLTLTKLQLTFNLEILKYH